MRFTENGVAVPLGEALWATITRLTRAQLATEAENYLKAVSRSAGMQVRFHRSSCLRLENGNVMAHGPNDRPPVPLTAVADAASASNAVLTASSFTWTRAIAVRASAFP